MNEQERRALRARYDAMTPEQKADEWDAYYHLSDRKWTLYQCSDCDPRHADPDDPEDVANNYTAPAMMVIPEGIYPPNFCPRCQGHLSMLDAHQVRVTTLGTLK